MTTLETCPLWWNHDRPPNESAYGELCEACIAERGGRKRRRNSPEVRERNRQASRRWRAANPHKVAEYARRAKPRTHRRRALSTGVRLDVFERDGWQCQIAECLCPQGRAIDPTLKGSPWAGQIDHVRPLARGGSDLKENLQAAHRACNRAKWTFVDG